MEYVEGMRLFVTHAQSPHHISDVVLVIRGLFHKGPKIFGPLSALMFRDARN